MSTDHPIGSGPVQSCHSLGLGWGAGKSITWERHTVSLGCDIVPGIHGQMGVTTSAGTFRTFDGGKTWELADASFLPARRLLWRLGARLMGWASKPSKQASELLAQPDERPPLNTKVGIKTFRATQPPPGLIFGQRATELTTQATSAIAGGADLRRSV